jgi:hypothetical protein
MHTRTVSVTVTHYPSNLTETFEYPVTSACYREAGRAVGCYATGLGTNGASAKDGKLYIELVPGNPSAYLVVAFCPVLAEARATGTPFNIADALKGARFMFGDFATEDSVPAIQREAAQLLETHWAVVEDFAEFLASADRGDGTLIDDSCLDDIWTDHGGTVPARAQIRLGPDAIESLKRVIDFDEAPF